jgi:hypothetical protein
MVKKWDDNNLLDTLKKHSQFQKCGILKLWKFKICTFENLKVQNFMSALPHINRYNVHEVLSKVVIYVKLNSTLKYYFVFGTISN